ncbi:MAG: hypothetical protein IT425_14770 [Pirellulales bacterium]|nr:hypothetical protein [Pirellulales bacterium]
MCICYQHVLVCVVFVLAWGGIASSGVGKDYFLTIGGGYDATGNQLSLERNVVFQQTVLSSRRPDKPSYDLWFADGNDPHPDLQCRNPKYEESYPLAQRMLAELLGDSDSADLKYRNHELEQVRGAAELKQVQKRFEELARELKAGDRVIVYAAGHGGKAQQGSRRRGGGGAANPYNTTLYFWNNEPLTARDFAGWLDRFPPEVEVVLVMVQCYAGGFAHTIFQQADSSKGLADHGRCGFFAQLHDRPAAGCTPDANEGDYEEYTSYFWGALGGASRSGDSVGGADFDGSGEVSFAEAHTYAVIQSDSIDVPVRTSESLLRRYSNVAKTNDAEGKLLKLEGKLSELAAHARPEQRAILEQLAKRLNLGADSTVADVELRIGEIKGKLVAAHAKVETAARMKRGALKAVQAKLYHFWPELRAEWSPLGFEFATTRADEFVSAVKELPEYATLQYTEKREAELSKAAMQLEREKACGERLQRVCETAVLAGNLRQVAEEEIVRRYEQLLRLEDGTLVEK